MVNKYGTPTLDKFFLSLAVSLVTWCTRLVGKC